MSEQKYFTKEDLLEKYEILEEVELKRGIKLDEDVVAIRGVLREYETSDQIAIGRDVRAKSNDFMSSTLLVQRVFYAEVGENQYRQLNSTEITKVRGSDQNIIARALKTLTGETESFFGI